MITRLPLPSLVAMAAIAATLLAGGCQTPASNGGSTTAPASAAGADTPNFGPPTQDVRTAATIQQMELDYIADKNSRPTYQHLAEAEQKKKAEEAAAAKKLADAGK